MTTNVPVTEETRERLASYKEAVGAATYDEAIVRLLRETNVESAFGTLEGWESGAEEDRLKARSDEGEV